MGQNLQRFQGQFLVTRINSEKDSLGGRIGPNSKDSGAVLIKAKGKHFPLYN